MKVRVPNLSTYLSDLKDQNILVSPNFSLALSSDVADDIVINGILGIDALHIFLRWN